MRIGSSFQQEFDKLEILMMCGYVQGGAFIVIFEVKWSFFKEQFEIVSETEIAIVGDAWTDYLPESAKLTADWTYPWVCGNCEQPKYGAVSN